MASTTMSPSRSCKLSRTTFASVLLISILTLSLTITYHHLNTTKPTIDSILAEYDPITRSTKARALLTHKCPVRLPIPQQLRQYPFSEWALSRFVAYYNIYYFLQSHWNVSTTKPNVLDFGGSVFLRPFNASIDVTLTKYPDVDIHRTKLPSNTYDAVAADQVLEHTTFPHLAMREMKRILKPGGIAIITTVAYNPLHETTGFHDLWRFMLDGLLVLSMPFEGGVKVCGSWGSAKVVAFRATHGMGSPEERRLHIEEKSQQLTSNDQANPFLVWLVVQK